MAKPENIPELLTGGRGAFGVCSERAPSLSLKKRRAFKGRKDHLILYGFSTPRPPDQGGFCLLLQGEGKMKQSETTLKTLARRYRAVLIKCALINLAAFAVVSPARALDISSGTYKDTKIPADTEEPISDITVSGGTFDNVMISAENSLTITGGTFRGTFYDYPTPTPYLSLSGKDVTITDGTFDNGMIYSNNSLKITGGNFTDMTFTSNSPTTEEKKNVGDLTITGGTFRGAFTLGGTSNLNLSGGNFDGVDWWWSGTANDLNIDSNKRF